MVFTWWREVLDGGHLELAAENQAEDLHSAATRTSPPDAPDLSSLLEVAKPKKSGFARPNWRIRPL